MESLYARTLRRAEDVRTFTITNVMAGWEVREEQNSRLVRRLFYDDWHRVERARMTFALEARDLQALGWVET